jgi:hypothetical protein
MHRRTLIGATAGMTALAGARKAWAQGEPVDLLLVLAVDVSRSIDDDEARLQREGYRQAITNPLVIEAIRGGMIGAVGLAYVEWAGWTNQTLAVPWTRISNAVEAQEFGQAIETLPRVSLNWTSISGAIRYGLEVLDQAPFEGTRKVIDISADGVNNSGPPVEEWRDRAVAAGVVINGLPIVNDRPGFGWLPPGALEAHFRERVTGGPGSFVIVAEDFVQFATAVNRKLIREIAGRPVAAG